MSERFPLICYTACATMPGGCNITGPTCLGGLLHMPHGGFSLVLSLRVPRDCEDVKWPNPRQTAVLLSSVFAHNSPCTGLYGADNRDRLRWVVGAGHLASGARLWTGLRHALHRYKTLP